MNRQQLTRVTTTSNDDYSIQQHETQLIAASNNAATVIRSVFPSNLDAMFMGYALSICRSCCFSPVPHLSPDRLTPPTLRYRISWNRLPQTVKALTSFRKLSRRSIVSRFWRELNIGDFQKAKEGEPAAAAANQRFSTQRLPLPISFVIFIRSRKSNEVSL
jgi:hypothetical protein